MNKFILGVSLVVTVLLSQTAAADSRHGRQGYNDSRFSGNNFRINNRNFDRRGNRNYSRAVANPYHYGRTGNRRGNNFVGISYGKSFYNTGFNSRFNSGFNNRFNNSFYNNGYRNRWDRNRNSNFVGGLVLGSLLSNQNYVSGPVETVRYRSAPVIREREIVYVNSSPRAAVPAPPKRRLLRDLQGDCYEIEISPNGDELRSQIDPAFCDF